MESKYKVTLERDGKTAIIILRDLPGKRIKWGSGRMWTVVAVAIIA